MSLLSLCTLKSVQVRRARTLQALNWASKCHVSRAKVGLLRLKCSGVERQLANSGNKQPNEPPHQFSGSGNWHELVRPHTCHETMHNQATLTDRAAMRRYDRPPPALSTPVLADSRVQKRGQRPGICALPLLARWTGLVQRTNTCTSRCEFYWLLNVGVRFERRVPVVNVSYMDVSMYVLFSRLTSNGIPDEITAILRGKIFLYMYKAR